jgi:phosphatidylserine/phosphatidylglycerophosphate/cardiolipin synthase-like enzyme
MAADDGVGRFLACTLFQAGAHPPQPVYVHAKIGIVDDRWLTIGSANLNEHSLFNDSEMNLVIADERLATDVRKRLWAEHLECSERDLDAPVHEVVDTRWRPRAEEELARISGGGAAAHRLSRLPHVSRRSRGILGPLNGLFVDG